MATLSPSQPEQSERVGALQRVATVWKQQLLDTTRSPLVYYRDLKTGTLDLTPGDMGGQVNPSAVDSLLAGQRVRLSNLIPEASVNGSSSLTDARNRVKRIGQVAQAYLEEKGASILFLAAGLATWDVVTGARPNAPVVMLPLTVEPGDAAHREFFLQVAGDAHFNPIMAHALRTEYGVELDDDDFDLEDPPDSFADVVALLGQVAGSLSQVPGLNITPRLVVGNFRYNNLPLVADLEQNLEAFAANDLVAAIAGVREAREALGEHLDDPPPDLPDTEPPDSEYLVMDADASQHQAINRALAGQSEIIWGPPGTGKSQTIANLIAALIANSKRVLFVAQKQAAVEVVINRLERAGLSDLVMDCHGGFKSRREFSRGLADAMQRIGSTPERDYSDVHRDLAERKRELVGHAEALHRQREPWKVSAFEVQAQLLEIPEEVRNVPRLPAEKVNALDRDGLRELQRDVERWIDLEGPWLAERYPGWAQVWPDSTDQVRRILDLIHAVLQQQLARCQSELSTGAGRLGLALPQRVGEWATLTQLLAEIEQYGRRFRPEIYGLDHAQLMGALKPRSGLVGRFKAGLSGPYRAARRAVQAKALDGSKLSGDDVYGAVQMAERLVGAWRFYSLGPNALPRALEGGGVSQLHDSVSELVASVGEIGEFLGSGSLLILSEAELRATLQWLVYQEQVAGRLPRLRELERRFEVAGIGQIVSAVERDFPVGLATNAIASSWLQGVWSELTLQEPRLAGFVGVSHNRSRDEFARLDAQHLQLNPARIRREAAEQATQAMNEHPEQRDLVRREAVKKSRHLSVRQLVHQAPEVLCGLRPCWMMSPLQVAEMIPADTELFDVVIFDEASQIPPAEAIGCLARAKQAVVAGDDRQLPPTSFFRSQEPEDLDDDDDSDDAAEGLALIANIESILDVVKGLPIKEQLLRWHYRSRDGRLIAFSNNHIYGEALTAFPGTVLESPLTFHQLDLPPTLGRSTRSHPDEVERVVDLIIGHARQRPEESLGVIAFGSHHAENIEEALRRRLGAEDDRGLDPFFAMEREERFFVKNIERVQGDERDVIILSVGYHKAANGTLPYRFGPLNQDGGERRLNVAITRARSRIHLVAGFSHHDMDPGRSSAEGVELLRSYLEFAATGGSAMGGSLSEEPLNAFELNIQRQLEKRGIPVTPQYGVAGYRLDFACAHPEQPGRMVLAVEADGASYHSAPTARDRDRLRQQVLENLGWRFHRIWSTEWFRDPEGQADLVLEAWRRAVAAADEADAGVEVANTSDPSPVVVPVTPVESERGPRPAVRVGLPITEYSMRELVALARWLNSDTLLRTDDELLREMKRELGFKRGGSRINAAILAAIGAARAD